MDSNMQFTDEGLVMGLKADDAEAIQAVYVANYPMIRKLVIDNNGSEDEAKDIYQEAFIVLYENLRRKGFRLSCKIKTYIYSVSRNLWLKELKKKSYMTDELYDNYEFADVNRDMDRHHETKERIAKVSNAMDALGEPCKSILTYFFFNRLTMEEIASNMGYTNAANAKNQKYKCVKRLKASVKLKG